MRHLRIHTGERQYTCKNAEYASKQKANLLTINELMMPKKDSAVHCVLLKGCEQVEPDSQMSSSDRSEVRGQAPSNQRHQIRLEDLRPSDLTLTLEDIPLRRRLGQVRLKRLLVRRQLSFRRFHTPHKL